MTLLGAGYWKECHCVYIPRARYILTLCVGRPNLVPIHTVYILKNWNISKYLNRNVSYPNYISFRWKPGNIHVLKIQ